TVDFSLDSAGVVRPSVTIRAPREWSWTVLTRPAPPPGSSPRSSPMPLASRHLKLEPPLAALDLERTGVDPLWDRIVENTGLKLPPGDERTRFRRLVNSGVPIPPSASAVHGLCDEDLAERP